VTAWSPLASPTPDTEDSPMATMRSMRPSPAMLP